jgi:hypothetical protein
MTIGESNVHQASTSRERLLPGSNLIFESGWYDSPQFGPFLSALDQFEKESAFVVIHNILSAPFSLSPPVRSITYGMTSHGVGFGAQSFD